MHKNINTVKEVSGGEIVLYKNKLEVRLEKKTVWLTQSQIAKLFGTKRPAITKHLSNIFKSKELKEKSVCSILEHTASDGKIYRTQFYNLDAIISVGYRVNSSQSTQFRIWATKVLKKHLVNGYTINEKRLKMVEHKYFELQKSLKLLGLDLYKNLEKKTGIKLVAIGFSHYYEKDFEFGALSSPYPKARDKTIKLAIEALKLVKEIGHVRMGYEDLASAYSLVGMEARLSHTHFNSQPFGNYDRDLNIGVVDWQQPEALLYALKMMGYQEFFGIDINPERISVRKAIEINSKVLKTINERIESLPHEKITECYLNPSEYKGDLELILLELMKK